MADKYPASSSNSPPPYPLKFDITEKRSKKCSACNKNLAELQCEFRLLPCLHTACLDCLKSCGGDVIDCSFCNQAVGIQDFDSFPVDYNIAGQNHAKDNTTVTQSSELLHFSNRLTRQLPHLKNRFDELESNSKILRSNYEIAEQKLTDWNVKVQTAIDDRVSAVQQEIKKAADQRVQKLVDTRRRDGQRCVLISKAARFIECLIENGSDADICLLKPVIERRVQELLAQTDDDNEDCDARGGELEKQVDFTKIAEKLNIIQYDDRVGSTRVGNLEHHDYCRIFRKVQVNSPGAGVHSASDEYMKKFGFWKIKAVLGSQGSGVGQFESPYSICCFKDLWYVTDSGNERLQIFSRFHLNHMATLPLNYKGCNSAGGVCVNKNEDVIVVNFTGECLHVYRGGCHNNINQSTLKNKNNNNFSSDNPITIGEFGSGDLQFSGPFGAACCPLSGDIYITDSCNHRVQVLSSDLQFKFSFGSFGSEKGQLEYPEGIRVTHDQKVIVSERGNNRVNVFSRDGQFINYIGENDLLEPVGVTSDDKNRVYVCDTGHNRICVYTILGEFLWASDDKNDTGLDYVFDAPTGICVDGDGNVAVSCNHALYIY